MTACIITEFPWAAIAGVTRSERPGVIVCTDTRVINETGGGIVPGKWAKQQQIAHNIFVCYTSTNLGATAAALKEVNGTRDVARIGIALHTHHGRQGGFTELITIVWRRDLVPQVLEQMPPNYKPRRRRGIIGIGDGDILQSFREQFFEEPRPDLVQSISEQARASLAQAIGRPVEPPRYVIDDAAANVGSAFVEAIRICRKPTVEIPVQLSCIDGGRVAFSRLAVSPDLGKTWTHVAAVPHEVKIPLPTEATTDSHLAPRAAVQLFL